VPSPLHRTILYLTAAGLRRGGLTAGASAWTPWCRFQVTPLTCTILYLAAAGLRRVKLITRATA